MLIRLVVLISSMMLSGCIYFVAMFPHTISFEPSNRDLPHATIGQPYQQLIYIHLPTDVGPLSTVNIEIEPENSGITWNYSDKATIFEYAFPPVGDIIKIIGTPTDPAIKEIKVAITASTLATMAGRAHDQKEYRIKVDPAPTSINQP